MSDTLTLLDDLRRTSGASLAGIRQHGQTRMVAYICGGALDAEIAGKPARSESAAVAALSTALGGLSDDEETDESDNPE